MKALNPYLMFDGTASEAMGFYASTLGGKLDVMMQSETPGDVGCAVPDDPSRVMHAHLACEGGVLMASDTMPGQPYERMQGFGLTLTYATVAEAERVFNALAEGGQVRMPLAKTFWVESFGMLVDRFGTPWLINGGQMMES
ncbi:VOC family protein [soil metagenome]